MQAPENAQPSVASLWAAAAWSYAAGPGGEAPADVPTPFDSDPYVVGEGSGVALVGTIGGTNVVAFRGTVRPRFDVGPNGFLPSLGEWLGHADLAHEAAFLGNVHRGFLRGVDVLMPGVREALREHGREDRPVCLVGHSKGGALATLAALRLRERSWPIASVTTFGSPRVGDAAFAEVYARHVSRHVRYEHDIDVVPHLPPRAELWAVVGALDQRIAALADDLEYKSVGRLHYVDPDGTLQADAPGLFLRRLMRLTRHLVTGQVQDIVSAHDLHGAYRLAVEA